MAAPLVFGFVVLVFAHERGPLSRLMSTPPIVLLGAWSYSIYMVHMLVLELVGRGLKFSERFTHLPTTVLEPVPWQKEPLELIALGDRWTMDGFALLYMMLVIAFAALTYRLVEQPGRRFFNQLASGQRDAPKAAPAYRPPPLTQEPSTPR